MEEQKNTNKKLIIVGIVAFGIILICFVFYMGKFFSFGFSESQEIWAQFGDYLGGVSNPFLSFLGLLALLYTISIQLKELRETRAERKQTLHEARNQSKLTEIEIANFKAQRKQDEEKAHRDKLVHMLESITKRIDSLLDTGFTHSKTGNRWSLRNQIAIHYDSIKKKGNRAGESGSTFFTIATLEVAIATQIQELYIFLLSIDKIEEKDISNYYKRIHRDLVFVLGHQSRELLDKDIVEYFQS